MSQIPMAGLLVPLPRPDAYSAQEYVPVPLTGVHVKVQVVNFLAQVEVIQEYQNKEKSPIEVTYYFPVEEEAAITECSADLDGRIVVAKIYEEAKAQKIFDDAIKENKTAFILEETKPDIFQLKIGNLTPGGKCKVRITYNMELPAEDGKTKLTIPTTVAPRYIPAEDDSEVARKIASIEHDFQTPADLHFQMDVAMKTKISSIASVSHQLVSTVQENQNNEGLFHASTTFEGLTTEMDRDIIILIDTEEPTMPKVILEKGEDGSVAAMVSIIPHFEQRKQPSEVIFLIDCSGSMMGESIQLAKEALHLFVHSLPVDCYFNIFLFGSTFTRLFPESRPFTDETLEMAKQLMKTVDADLGGTEIYQPLETIFQSQTLVGKPRQVFVITDGEVWNSHECVQLVEKNNQHNRVFTLGIGASADRHLVKGMARAGMGLARFTTYGENIAGKVLKQLKQSLQSCAHDVHVDWGQGASGKVIECCQAPLQAPPVYDGSRLVVYKLWDKECSVGDKVTITADKPEGQMSVEVDIEANSYIEGDLIHKMFARKMIQDLEEKSKICEDGEIKSLITDLGLKYSLMTRYTSFVGVDEESSIELGTVMKRQVRNQLAHGYGGMICSQSGMDFLAMKRKKKKKMICVMNCLMKDEDIQCHVQPIQESLIRESVHTNSVSLLGCGFDNDSDEEKLKHDFYDELEQKQNEDKEPKSKIQNLLMLTSLQTAIGFFKEDELVENLIGQKFDIFRTECMDKGIETRVWLTAIIIAFIEEEFSDERDSWKMIVEKAREWLNRNELILAAYNCLMQ